MGTISNWMRKLRERLFNPAPPHPPVPTREPSKRPMQDTKHLPPRDAPSSPQDVHLPQQPVHKQTVSAARKPYFLQIGFDFGTAFSKCVIRDVGSDKAWVFVPPNVCSPNLPFLIPSRLRLDGETLLPFACGENHYASGHLSMFKLALHQAITGNAAGSLMREYEDLKNHHGLNPDLDALLEACTTAYLAFAFAHVQAHLYQKYADFGKVAKDSLFVNLGVLAAAADHDRVSRSFGRALNLGWRLRKSINRSNGILLTDVLRQTMAFRSAPTVSECCYVYPEVSANVQGFVRSRTSTPGIFLFVDTGAASVDASVFIFTRNDDDLVAYLDAGVFPLGSAWIERLAGESSNRVSTEDLERLRRLKETNSRSPELDGARKWILEKLGEEIVRLLTHVKKKRLYLKDQLSDITLIFGGGGHAINPYEQAVRNSFHSSIFRDHLNPPAIGLPSPRDLELPIGTHKTWLPRLGVAYGLSFPKYELHPFILPNALPDAIRVWQDADFGEKYISKEMC